MEYTSREDLPIILDASHISMVLGVSKTVAYGIMKSEGFPSLKINAKRIVAPRDRFLAWVDQLATEQANIK